MSASVRTAAPDDIGLLVELMSEFYAESDYTLDAARATEAFRTLLSDPRLGMVWLLEEPGAVAGYVVATLGFSMEYGGHDAFVDDLFVRPGYRQRGHGARALAAVQQFCEAAGVRAIHLEVERGNEGAQRLYRQVGFTDNARQLLTLRLAAPSHLSPGAA